MIVVKAPDNKLRTKTKPVKKISRGLIHTISEMIKITKTFEDPEGVGLASTQVGLEERFFIGKIGRQGVKKEDDEKVPFETFINPEILSWGKKTKSYFEGCLSIPDFYGEVNRFLAIEVRYKNDKGGTITKKLEGVDAWIFQHEVDHLDGILFPDRVLEQKGRFFKFTGKDKAGADMFEEVTV